MKHKQARLDRAGGRDPAKVNLGIDIKNFGPISSGRIRLAPLTVFIGPNSSGKSYAAMLVHSILSAENKSFPVDGSYDLEHDSAVMEIARRYEKALGKVMKRNAAKQTFFIPEPLARDMASTIIQSMLEAGLSDSISRNFGSDTADLVTARQKSARVRVGNSDGFVMSIREKLRVRYDAKNTKFKIKISTVKTLSEDTAAKKNTDTITIYAASGHMRNESSWHKVSQTVVAAITKKIRLPNIPAKSFYLPAIGSGILHDYRTLSIGVIRDAAYAATNGTHGKKPRQFSSPALTGSVSDLVSNIIMLDDSRAEFYDLANELESELLGGEIKAIVSKDSVPKIVYRASNITTPLHRASSTVSELAPLSLYLKHIMAADSILIIEEPEAHLHPANQAVFARYVVRMIREGLNVLITTHSMILLDALGRYVRSNRLDGRARKKLGWDADDYLKYDEVSPHVFYKTDAIHHTIKPVMPDGDEGIPQKEFLDAYEALYQEEIKLEKLLGED